MQASIESLTASFQSMDLPDGDTGLEESNREETQQTANISSKRTSPAQSQFCSQMADPALLSKIDKLFAYGIGEYIDLPQLVVVGDQSSGKSSVLEGLTKLPFPRDSGLCTRFATQITFRRASELKTTVSIIPSRNTNLEYQQTLRNWRKVEPNGLKAERFGEIMREVQEVIGIKRRNGDRSGKSFSEDILRLEICGPNQEHFSVVDVPGIFRKTTEGVTSKEDMAMVKSMVKGYMSNPRSIMLAVVPANVDVATQDILTMAEEEDPEGTRTLGVLTKPDLVDQGAEFGVIDLLQGRSHQLKLGWCVVRNPGQKDLSDPSIDRDVNEKKFFLGSAPWSLVDSDRVGIHSLRSRLQEILGEHVRREFPRVKAEISKKLSAAKRDLENLGDSRETTDEQRQYLFDLCSRYQQITTDALNSDYASSELFNSIQILRLPTKVVNRNEEFSEDMDRFGHQYDLEGNQNSGLTPLFGSFGLKEDDETDASDSESELRSRYEQANSDSGDGEDEEDTPTPSAKVVWARRFTQSRFAEDIEDLTIERDASVSTEIENTSKQWLKGVYKNSRGFELGTFDKTLLAATMKEQSNKWDVLALGYISDVIHMVHAFINELLAALCPDARLRSELMCKLMDDDGSGSGSGKGRGGLVDRYRAAFDHVRFLLQVERSGIPATMDTGFHDRLEHSRRERVQKELAPKSFSHVNSVNKAVKVVVNLGETVAALGKSASNDDRIETTASNLQDILKAYYRIALRRFIDNVCMQASMHFLLKGSDDTPLKLFSPKWVSKLSPEALEEIAGEDVVIKRKRATLKKTIENLGEGKKILY